MRGYLVGFLAALAIPLAFLSPFAGLLSYCWLSYMRPTEWAWGAFKDVQFGLYVAVALFLGLAARGRIRFFRWNAVTAAMLALWAWWGLTSCTAIDRDAALPALKQISTIFLICLVTTGLANTKERVRAVIVTIACSLAFHAVKFGLYGVMHPDVHINNVIGGMLSGNNENALAFDIVLPFLVYLGFDARGFRRLAWWSAAALTVCAVVFSYSRGGFLGMCAAFIVMIWKTRARIPALFVGAPTLVALFLLLAPQAHIERIAGIRQSAATDQSVMLRFEAWHVAGNAIAKSPLVGIGPKNFLGQSYRFDPPPDFPRMEIHNTYIEFACSSGIPGLLLYLTLVFFAFRTCSRVQREVRTRGDPRLAWFARTATGLEASMVAFLVASTFGSLMHFDLMYHVCALVACLPVALAHEVRRLEEETPPAGRTATSGAPAAAVPPVKPALSRYDRSPVLPCPVPAGMPSFRGGTAMRSESRQVAASRLTRRAPALDPTGGAEVPVVGRDLADGDRGRRLVGHRRGDRSASRP